MTDSLKSAHAEKKLPTILTVCARFFREKIGWNRIGVVLSLTIIGIAFWALYHILHDIDVREVFKAIRATSGHNILLAAVFVGAAYFTLTFYDLFALRTIGRADVPYHAAALASFTSYSVGHNVGASVFTGGAVRYRIYSAWGLDAAEVAKICFVAGLTFWLGNATVLGLGIAYEPEVGTALDRLPPLFNRALGLLALAVLTAYVVWVWWGPRAIGRGQWQVTLPGGPLTLLQIVIGIVDLTFCALAVYMLVPVGPSVDFITLSIIFVSATLLGFASHSPGGLGVFDAAMLGALLQYNNFNKDELPTLLAGLLLFRLLYYIVPFILSLSILGGRELHLSVFRRRSSPVPVNQQPAASDVVVHKKDEV